MTATTFSDHQATLGASARSAADRFRATGTTAGQSTAKVFDRLGAIHEATAEGSKLRKGDRCEVSGMGRTASWLTSRHGCPQGTVQSRRGGRVFVRWDGTSFEDEMQAFEVRPVSAK